MGGDPQLAGAQGGRQGRQQHPGHGAVAAQPGELRRPEPGCAAMERRHRRAVPPRGASAVLRPVPQAGRAQGRPAGGGLHLQHRREPLGPVRPLAAGLRPGLRRADDRPLPPAELRAGVRPAGGRRRRRQLRVRPGQAGALPAAAGVVRRQRALEVLAHHRPTQRGRPAGRSGLRDGAAHRPGAHLRRAARRPVCRHDRDRRGLGGQADRRAAGRHPERSDDERLPAAGGDGHLPRPLPHRLRPSEPDPGERGAALPLHPAAHQPRVPARAPHHGADPVQLVPAL